MYVVEDCFYVYACDRCKKEHIKSIVKTTDRINFFLKGTVATPELISYILIRRYRYKESFYKQSKRFRKYGFNISYQTLFNWRNKIDKIYFYNKIANFDFFSIDEKILFYDLIDYINNLINYNNPTKNIKS